MIFYLFYPLLKVDGNGNDSNTLDVNKAKISVTSRAIQCTYSVLFSSTCTITQTRNNIIDEANV